MRPPVPLLRGSPVRSAPAAMRKSTGVGEQRMSVTEVVVIHYEHGIAYVRPWAELEGDPLNGLPDRL